MALVALIVGGNIWGIVGMIIFVPFVGILKCIFDEVEDLRPYGYLLGNTIEYENYTAGGNVQEQNEENSD
jgi:predicted PurR-regulated permease PerM